MPATRVYNKLTNTTAVTDLVSTKIYPVRVRQGTALPYISFQMITEALANVSVGTSSSDTATAEIQIDCWAATYSGAKALGKAVRDALKEWTDTGNTPPISSCHFQGETDMPEDVEPGQDTQTHRVSQTYLLQYALT